MSDEKSGIGPGARREQGIDVPVVPPTLDAAKVAPTTGPQLDKVGADGVLGVQHEFDLDYLDSRQRRWTGTFTVKALSVRDRIQVGLTRSRLLGGLPADTVDSLSVQLAEILAHLSVAIVASPDWAKDLLNLQDYAVLYAVYKEVAAYEARFLGTEPPKAG